MPMRNAALNERLPEDWEYLSPLLVPDWRRLSPAELQAELWDQCLPGRLYPECPPSIRLAVASKHSGSRAVPTELPKKSSRLYVRPSSTWPLALLLALLMSLPLTPYLLYILWLIFT